MTKQELIKMALKEDLPNGDLTTDSLSIESYNGRAKLVAKEDLVLSGSELFEGTVLELELKAKLKWHFKNGDLILKNQTVCSISADLIPVLKAERVALNFLGHLSGIATLTRCFVKAVEGTDCKILDTRKTTPTLRDLEKQAVQDGSGFNHRLNLSTAVLIKENHIRLAGSITEAVKQIRFRAEAPIRVEVTSLEEVKEALQAEANALLLDNMSNETLKEALQLIPATVETEASGNMTLERVRSVAQLGVNAISVGAITHSAPTADFSLLFEWEENK